MGSNSVLYCEFPSLNLVWVTKYAVTCLVAFLSPSIISHVVTTGYNMTTSSFFAVHFSPIVPPLDGV